MPMHITPAFYLCNRDTFGEQEQLFSFLTSSQEHLSCRLCPDPNVCSLMMWMCCVLYVIYIRFNGSNHNIRASFETSIFIDVM